MPEASSDSPLRMQDIPRVPAYMAVFLTFIYAFEVPIPAAAILLIGAPLLLYLAATSRRDPTDLFLFALAYIPFTKQFQGDFGALLQGFNLTTILVGLLLLRAYSLSRATGTPFFPRHVVAKLIVLLVLLMVMGIGMSAITRGGGFVLSYALPNSKRWLDALLFFFVAYACARDRDVCKKALYVMIIVVILISLAGMKEHLDRWGRSSLDSARVAGVFEQPNNFAAFFAYYFPLVSAFILFHSRKRAMMLGGVALAAITTKVVFATMSRGSIVAYLAANALVVIRKKISWFVWGGILLAGLALMFPQILPESIIGRFSSTVQSEGSSSTMEGQLEESAAQRIIVWRTATAMLWENPLGYGFGSFPLLLPEYLSRYGERMLSITDAHNMYLLIAVEMGVPALVVFLLIWFVAFGVSVKVYRVSPDINVRILALGMQGCVVGAIIANQFGSRFYDTEVTAYFWALLGILVRASTFPTNAPSSPEPDTERRAHG